MWNTNNQNNIIMKIKHLLIGLLAVAAAVSCKQEEVVETPSLELDKTSVSLAATSGEASFNVTTNQAWVATADADWVSLDPSSGEASSEAVTVKVTAEDNESTEARTATVTVQAGELTETVEVSQAGSAVPEPEPLPTPNPDWTSDKVVSYDLPEDASSKRQLLKNIKYHCDENYFYVKLQSSVAEFDAAPAEYLGVFIYDVTDGSGDGYYGWWNDAKGNSEFEGEHIGVFTGRDVALTIGETPVEVVTEVNGDELVWTMNIPRSAEANLALENPHFAFLTYIGWEPNGALPDKYDDMLQFTAPTNPEVTVSEWALVGSFNEWNPASDLYLSVLDEEYFVYYGFELAATTEFKFLKGGVWPPEGQEIGGNGLVEPNTIQPAGGSNIKVTEAGKYDIYLAADLTKFYVMSEGKLPSEATEPAPVENSWGMMGCFVDNLWGSDVPMTKEGEWIVAKGAQFTELTFKIRANSSWADATNIGVAPGSERGVVNGKISVVTAEYSKANCGGDAADIKLNGEAGTYDVYFSFENLEVYVMEEGFKPGEKEPQNPDPVEITYTVTGTIKGTDADKKANYWNSSNEPGLMTLEGDYYIAKNVEFDYDYRFSDNGSGEDFVKFKICETGTWNAYGQAEEAINKPNTGIAVQMDGADIYLDKSGVYDVYFDKTNGKVWVMEAGYKPGEEIARLDGYQWMGEFDDRQILFDFGVAEEGMLSIALPTMDESGFALHMVGFYEIEATDKSSGVILFTQYDWEWDEMGEEFEIQYSELTANSVKVVCENVFGVAEPVAFTRMEYPCEILPPGGGGESPEGPIADGGYWFTNSGKVMAPMAEDATSGMFPAKDLINYASTVKNTFTFTYDPDMSYYTIQDSYGRYLGNESWGEDISLTTVLPTGEDYAYYLWCIDDSYDDGTVDIYNAATYNGFAYSSANNNWYLDPASYETDGIRPFLVAADNPVEEPVEPEGPKVVTVAEFLAATDNDIEYQVSGTVSGIYQAYNPSYGNISIYISDETGEMLAYRLSCEGINDPANTITKGDLITVKGKRTLYNEKPQMAQGCVIVEHTDVVIEAPEGSATLSFADTANRTVFTTSQQVWEQNGIKFTNDKGSSTSNVADYSAPARFYKNSKITVEYAGMTKIEFTCNNSSYATALESSITSGNVSVSGSVVTVTLDAAADSYVVSALSGGQVRMDSVTVYAE